MGRKVCVALVDSEEHWAAERPKRARMVKEAKGGDGKGQGKKGKSDKGKTDDGRRKGKSGKWQTRKTFEGYCNHCWKWGHMEKDCFTETKEKGGKGKSAGSLDESEASGPENTSVGGFGLCSFGNQCSTSGNNYRIATFTLDIGAAVSAARKSL